MSDELRARDIWRALPRRVVVGQALVRRVGARAWEAPEWARVHARFFDRCGVPDPFDPSVEDKGVGLGEVGLAQPRRAPAPHALPPEPKKAGPSLPNVPSAPRPTIPPPPSPDGRAAGKPAPKIGEQRRDDTADLKKKLAEKERLRADPARASQFKVDQPVARLPMRPDLPPGAPARAATATPPQAPSPALPGSAPTPPRPPTTGEAASRSLPPRLAPPGGTAARAGSPTGPRPALAPPSRPARPMPMDLEPEEVPVERPRAAPPVSAYAFEPEELPLDTGRAPDIAGQEVGDPFAGLGPRRTVGTPSSSTPNSPTARPAGPATSAPPVARTPPRAGGGGLDDLFGMGAGDNTRIRIPKRDEAPAETRPRRPMVVSDAEAAAGGIDRRPPPAKPPVVTASAPARALPGPDVLSEED